MTEKPSLADEFELNLRQEDFVYEYAARPNGNRAAINAGYSEKTARQIASELLTKPNVQAAIAKLRAERAKRYEITAENVLAEYAKIGFSNMDDYVDVTGDAPKLDFVGLTRDELASVSEITVTTKNHKRKSQVIDGEDEYEDELLIDEEYVTDVKFKLHSKQTALDALSRNLGLFEKDNKQTAPTIVIKGRSADL